MDAHEIERRRQAVIKRHGHWSAHNVHLGHGIYTFDRDREDFDAKIKGYSLSLRRMLQVAADLTGREVGSLRVLDLACLEGIYAVEFALRGAEAVGIEVREGHVAKANLAKEALGLDRLTFVRDDVRNLSVEKYGRFDLTMAIGIAYHLTADDARSLFEKIYSVTTSVAIIETHFATSAESVYRHGGKEYRGWVYREHEENATPEQKEAGGWSSIDNTSSFWFTRPSLYNLLADVGFTSAYSSELPQLPGQMADRDVFVAVKGEAVPPPLCFGDVPAPEGRWPENWREPGARERETQAGRVPVKAPFLRRLARRAGLS